MLARVLSIDYGRYVCTIKQTEAFNDWMNRQTRQRLLVRLRKASLGNMGDVNPVEAGVFEMREFFGPGRRVYYVQRESVLIVMLGGGDESSQQADIAAAQALAGTIEE